MNKDRVRFRENEERERERKGEMMLLMPLLLVPQLVMLLFGADIRTRIRIRPFLHTVLSHC